MKVKVTSRIYGQFEGVFRGCVVDWGGCVMLSYFLTWRCIVRDIFWLNSGRLACLERSWGKWLTAFCAQKFLEYNGKLLKPTRNAYSVYLSMSWWLGVCICGRKRPSPYGDNYAITAPRPILRTGRGALFDVEFLALIQLARVWNSRIVYWVEVLLGNEKQIDSLRIITW